MKRDYKEFLNEGALSRVVTYMHGLFVLSHDGLHPVRLLSGKPRGCLGRVGQGSPGIHFFKLVLTGSCRPTPNQLVMASVSTKQASKLL